MKVLITGASGFIGSFLVEESLRRGYETWAAIRKNSSKEFLKDERIHFIELDFSSEDTLKKQLENVCFDYVIHSAGVTKCLHKEDFYRINTQGTAHLVQALLAQSVPIKRFIFLSSLSLFGPIHEEYPYKEITETDIPCPNTEYGKSKWQAEQMLTAIGNNFPYIVIRPTGVYGPREKDYFMMAQSIKKHIDFAAGYKKQDLTFVYVQDVVQACFLAFDRGMNGRTYFVSDGNVYSSRHFSDLIRKELGYPWCLRIVAPLWILRLITLFGDLYTKCTGKPTALNSDKYNILKQRNWRCNIEPTVDELGYHPHFNLEKGVKHTIEWYKERGEL